MYFVAGFLLTGFLLVLSVYVSQVEYLLDSGAVLADENDDAKPKSSGGNRSAGARRIACPLRFLSPLRICRFYSTELCFIVTLLVVIVIKIIYD